jgi:phage terminase large subunit-like protein
VGRWIQRSLVHGEGDVLGKPVRLTLPDWYILDRMFQYDPVTGALLYHRVLVLMAKGNSKTERLGLIGDAELCGPIAPISPRVVLSAAGYDQTRELFTAARLGITGTLDAPGPIAHFFREGEHLLENRILLPEGHGYIERIAAVGGTNDGGKPTTHLGDELHEWVHESQERVYVVQSKGLRKRRVPRRTPRELGLPPGVQLRGALQVGISTMGASKDSLLGRLYEHGVNVARGYDDDGNDVIDPGFLMLCWEADEGWDLGDPAQLRQAILEANPLAGTVLPIENLIDAYHDRTLPRSEFVRYNLDRWPTGSEALIPSELWDACAGDVMFKTTLPLFVSVVVSHDHRHAAIAMCQREGDRYQLRVHTEKATSDDVLTVATLEKRVRDLKGRYPARVKAPVRMPGRDRETLREVPGPLLVYHGAFFEGSAQRLKAEGMHAENQPLSRERLAGATQTLRKLVIDRSEGELVHDGGTALRDAIGNVVGTETPKGWYIEPLDPRYPIAAAQAAMVALERALLAPPATSRRMRL